MRRVFGLGLVGLLLALPALVRADEPLNGNWQLTTLAATGGTETTDWVLKLQTIDGKTKASLVVANPTLNAPEVTGITVTDDHVRLTLKYGSARKGKTTLVFEGHVTKDSKKIVGVVGEGTPAYLAHTDVTELDPTDISRKLPVEELKAWASMASRLAKEHNSLWAMQLNKHLTEVFLKLNMGGLAGEYALATEKALDSKAAAQMQVNVLETVANALKAAGKDAELALVTERLAKLEKALDDEYLTKVPPFKGKPYAGRKEKSDRVVVMELFTGAQCNPCIAADVAFDVLGKTYKDSELALIEYHMHIPGPDPMTNPDTEARWKYYRDFYGKEGVAGTPTTLFNGTPKVRGGGNMAGAEAKYGQYTRVIDPLLETQASCKVSATATRVRDKVLVQTEVTGLEKPGKGLKLRIVLVEEVVRFVGSNKIRFHHHVVRAMPGGANGVAILKDSLSSKSEVDLNNLRKQLNAYLDDYAANSAKPFAQPGRPMSMEHLCVIAFVQDDTSKEILQAVQVNVAD